MAPPKVVKKTPKAIESPTESPINKARKNKKRSCQSFSRYIYKILQSLSPEEYFGITRKSLSIMDNFVNDMLKKIAAEAGRLVAQSKQKTLSSRDIQTAVRLLVPEELAKHANMKALKAIQMYQAVKTE